MRRGHGRAVNSSTGLPIASATITVYHVGTTTIAPIYSDEGVTSKANPFTSDTFGRFDFYAPDGDYDVKVEGSGITPYTIPDWSIVESTQGGFVLDADHVNALLSNAQYNRGTAQWNRINVSKPAWRTEADALGANDFWAIYHAVAAANPITWTELLRLSSIGALHLGGLSFTASDPTNRGLLRLAAAGGLEALAGIEAKVSTAGLGYGWKIAFPDLGGGDTPLVIGVRGNALTWTERLRINVDGRVTLQPGALELRFADRVKVFNGAAEGSLTVYGLQNNVRTAIDLGPTRGTPPAADALAEIVWYRTLDQAVNYERFNFSAMASGGAGYRFGQEFGGTGVRQDIAFAQENGVTAGTEIYLRIGARDSDSQRIQIEHGHLRFEVAARGGAAAAYWIGRGGGNTMNYNVPTSAAHQFLVNNVAAIQVLSSGLELDASGVARMTGQNRFRMLQSMARVTKTGTQALPTATEAAITFDSEDFDTDTLHDNVTNNTRLTAPIAGKYRVFGVLVVSNTNNDVTLRARVRKDGSTFVYDAQQTIAITSTTYGVVVSTIVSLAATNYIELMGTISDAAGGTVQTTTHFGMAYVGE